MEFTGKRVFVINNPINGDFQNEIEREQIQTRRFYLVRDPRAVTASYARHNRVSIEEAIESWTAPALDSFVGSYDINDSNILRYEQLRENPQAILKKIGREVSVDYDDRSLRYWDFEHHLVMANTGMVACIKLHQKIELGDFPGKDFYQSQVESEKADPTHGFSDTRWEHEFSTKYERLLESKCAKSLRALGYAQEQQEKSNSLWRVGRLLKNKLQQIRSGDALNKKGKQDLVSGKCSTVFEDSEFSKLSEAFSKLEVLAATDPVLAPSEKILAHYKQPDVLMSYWTHLDRLIRQRVPDFSHTTGVDYGCWYGLSSLVLHYLGAGRVIGLDVLSSMVEIATHCADLLALDNMQYQKIADAHLSKLPLNDATADWVLSNDVFSFASPASHKHMISEAFRLLRPGGKFVLSDGNNPHCEGVQKRLLETYHQHEIGDGDALNPSGIYWRIRKEMIRKNFPETDEDAAALLARDCAYCWGEGLLQQVNDLSNASITASAIRFDPSALRPPLHPQDGRSIGSITEPQELLNLFKEAGFSCSLWIGAEQIDGSPSSADLAASERFHIEGVRA